ncbi:Transcription-repair coupling factor (Superfamily II helicase)) [Alteracholeplasma palmae J233]|uniref:Transcription-repair-coupling factor n=1 Tax=Alteracholeplasma palmae (strain ATCC 49389 / J233) TaxID=1318466 RepID=U4KQX2_ALTPJ|nr:transcription-repair coupling factor [Alteracholeplasma palmae]CCV63676.1 Transcription-repair coupling factor (Superfamily II helicase)) [Alteracholeplasma palmae J233]
MDQMIKDQLKIRQILNKKEGQFKKLNDPFLQYTINYDFLENKENILVVAPNLYEAQKYYDQLTTNLSDDSVLFYPVDQTLTSIMALGSPEFKNERLYTLRQILNSDKKHIVVTTHQGLGQLQLSPVDYEKSVYTLYKNKDYDIEKITKTLVYNGYTRNYTVERPGEFSIRGNIIDIFTPDNPHPFRLDFFGDELESIKLFDVETQKSFEFKEKISIAPLHELFFTDEQKNSALIKIKEYFYNKELSEEETQKLSNDLLQLEERQKLDKLSLYTYFFTDQFYTILDFFKEPKIYMIDKNKMLINEKTTYEDLLTYNETLKGDHFTQIPYRKNISEFTNLKTLDFYITDNTHSESIIDLNIIDFESLHANFKLLKETLKQYHNYTIILGLTKPNYKELVEEFLDTENISYNKDHIKNLELNVITKELLGSFINPDEKLLVISETEIFNSKFKTRIQYRSVINQAVKIRSVDELNEGDYVVHYDYGIGQYKGLKTMDLSGNKRDYLYLVYANDESLYVPVDKIDLVLKYKSYENGSPKLSKLGGKQWSKTKANVKKRIKDLSDRLLVLYAKRNAAIGFSFSNDNEMMQNFENDFAYQTTKDQQEAIDQVKNDMHNQRPMDRLIAGDVGFGKTEVALRAAFKAVLDAKQVAYLVPTTVLARQHFHTFKDRFEKYGANVALLSRFVSPKQQKETIDKIKAGLVDVVIGTHRLLSEDIKFKDLGLFIIDEEQRFGVEHKEKIKEMKINVDTLTLSATPIPRTVQMAMYGLKDLSMIETPPLNRYPVQTYVVERQDALIKEAIQRELARGGQIFYLYNKTSDIENIVLKLKKLVPEARITYAHGKMNKEKLEDVLTEFIDHQFDILVATTIIETGVDIPNTNTLIIHDADNLGLSQLYQVRGRVGRSDRIAYAYLMYDARKNINDEAKKRLSVIEDFTDLGSGFKIALRDLSIRGAGDILGEEQSGFIDSVGMDLYMKLLDEVMQDKPEEQEPKIEVVDEVYSDRHIEKEYIESDAVRIEIHKRISQLNSIENVSELKVELEDRFGKLSPELVLYMYEKLFKKLSSKLGVEKVIPGTNEVLLVISIEKSKEINGEKLFEIANNSKIPIKLGYLKGRVQITVVTKNEESHWLYIICKIIENYYK